MSELPIIGGGGSSYILAVTSVDASDYIASGGGTPGDVDLSGGDVYVTDDLEVDGYATFGSGSTSHSLGANGDVFVSGKLEVDSDVELDGTVYFNSSASFGNLKLLVLGGTTQNDLVIYGDRTADQAVCMIGDQVGRQLVLSNGAMFGKDFGHADAGFPVLYLQSDEDPTVDATEYVSAAHNGTNGVIQTGKGNLTIGSGSTSNSLNANGDLMVSGKLEIDNTAYFDNGLNSTAGSNTFEGVANLKGGVRIAGVTNSYSFIYGSSSFDQLVFTIGADLGSQLILAGEGLYNKDFGHADAGFPVLYLQSDEDPTVDATEYVSAAHNGTNGVIQTGKGNLTIGSGSTSHSLNANGDLMVSGKVEVDGDSYFDGPIKADSSIQMYDTDQFYQGTGADVVMSFDASYQDADCWVFAVDDAAKHAIWTLKANRFKNHGHSASSNPTKYIHSSRTPEESDQEWYSFAHDGDDAVFSCGHGGYSWGVEAQSARGTVTFSGVPTADDTLVINATTITFKADGSGNVDHCTIGGDASECVTNLLSTLAECSESANLSAWAGAGDTVVIEWGTAGTAGNAIVFTESADNTAVDGSGTLGGTHAGVVAATHLTVDEAGFATFGSGSTSHSLDADGDLMVSGKIEVDGTSYLDGGVFSPTVQFASSTFGQISRRPDDGIQIALGTSGAGNNNIYITTYENRNIDHHHSPMSPVPTLFLHSGSLIVDTEQEYLSQAHDGDDAVFSCGHGGYSWGVEAQSARGTVTFSGIPTADDTLVINATTITFKADGSGNVDHCTIGGDASECVTNLLATLAECSESANLSAWAGVGDTVVIQWGTAGTAGNAIVFTESADNTAVDGSGTLGGTHTGVAAATHLTVDEAGFATFGSGSTSHSLDADGDLFVSGQLEVAGNSWFDGDAYVAERKALYFASVSSNSSGVSSTNTQQVCFFTGSRHGRNFVFCDRAHFLKNFGHAVQAEPTVYMHSATDPATRDTEYATLKYNELTCGADYGAFCGLKSLTEEVTISVGNGSGGVATSGNLAPAASLVMGVAVRCTDAPGGGATEYDVGITGSGNVGELIAGGGVSLGDTAVSAGGNDTTALPIVNGTATTLTITTDGDVTIDDMKVRVTVFYFDMSAPQS